MNPHANFDLADVNGDGVIDRREAATLSIMIASNDAKITRTELVDAYVFQFEAITAAHKGGPPECDGLISAVHPSLITSHRLKLYSLCSPRREVEGVAPPGEGYDQVVAWHTALQH